MNEGNDKDKIVPSSPSNLTTRGTGLVRRGLQDLAVTAPKAGNRILVAIGKHILAADDLEVTNEELADILSLAGYAVKTTTHPSEVLALATEFRPQVALIGLATQETTGVTLSEQLVASFPNLKIVLTGKEVPEWALGLLLDKGVACDTLEAPFERKDLLEMISTWVSGSDHIDPATHLRDAKHYRMGLCRSGGADNSKNLCFVNSSRPLAIYIEFVRGGSSPLVLENQISFLRRLGILLRRYARNGSAYRYGETHFAIILPRASIGEGLSSSKWLMQELKSLLSEHNLSHDFTPCVSLVSLPDEALSTEKVMEAWRELTAEGKTAEADALIEQIITDTWTGLRTERFFMEALSSEWKRSERNKLIFSLIDIDMGDIDALLGKTRDWQWVLLSQVGDTIDKTCRRSDVCCHYNLGEFLILLPETPTETACSLAQQLHSLIKDAAAYVLSGYRPPVTLSVATYPSDGTTPVDLVHSLDDAMLLLKNSTRDGVAAASKGVLSPP
jgi:diguanylate cyclase (GGDEF)-like protein